MPKRVPPLTGQRFGRLLVLGMAEPRTFQNWCRVRCDCGTEKEVSQSNLRNGHTGSCGCAGRERIGALHRTHGMTETSEYGIWNMMKQRCANPNVPTFKRYGGRGISVCDVWRDSFEAFYRDMGPRPTAFHSIDRIDNDGNYCPENCRWATQPEQGLNTSKNRRVSYRGEALTVGEWARRASVKRLTLHQRLARGWPIENAISGVRPSGQKKTRSDAIRYVFGGDTRTLKEWSGVVGIPLHTLKNRTFAGWPVARFLTTPARPKRPNGIGARSPIGHRPT
jgi:hypothetical protein